MCWYPRAPQRLRAERDGYALVLPCRACPGCLELARRRLASRLHARYPRGAGDLYACRLRVGAAQVAPLARNLHRRPGLRLEPGLFRDGPDSLIVLGRDERVLRAVARELGYPSRVWRVRLERGRATWSKVTAGLLVPRDAYGEQTNRWYSRGLAPLEKLSWSIVKVPRDSAYSKLSSPRAWAGSGLILVPPELWREHRLHRLPLHELLSYLNRRREAASALADDRVEQLRLDGGRDLIDHPTGGRYASSVRSEVSVPADIQEIIDRLKAKARDRGRGG